MQPEKLLICTALTLSSFLPFAQAEDWYAETFIAGVVTDGKNSAIGPNQAAVSSIGLRGGYQLNKSLSVEIEGQRGLDGDDDVFLFGTDAELDLHAGYALFGKYSVPVNERVALYGRLGLATTEFRTRFEIGSESIDTFVGLAAGVGTEIELTDTLYLRSDLTQYDSSEQDSTSISIGAGVRF